MSLFSRRSHAGLLLAMILALGGALRFWGLEKRGLAFYDEGSLAQVAKGPAIACRWALRSVARGDPLTVEGLKAEYAREGFPYPYAAAKHGYAAPVSAGMTLFGIRDVVPLGVSALFGTLSLVWVWRIGLLTGGVVAAGCAAALMAVSSNHVFFSRSGFAHAASVFFALGSVFHAIRRPSLSARAGFWAGLAFTCHYNLYWLFVVLPAWEVLCRWRRPGRDVSFLGPLAAFAGSGAVPLAAWELVTRSARWILGAWIPGVATYLEEVVYSSTGLATTVFSGGDAHPWFYVIHTVRTEGLLFAFLAAAALGWTVVRWLRRPAAPEARLFLLALGVLWVYVAYSASPFMACRTLLVVIPFGALLIAAMACHRTWGWTAAVLIVSAQSVLGWSSLREILRARSPYPGLVAEARGEGKRLVAVGDYPVVEFYGKGNDGALARTRQDLELLAADRPVRLLAVNRGGRWGFEDPLWSREGRYEAIRWAVATLRPSRVVPFGMPLAFDDAASRFGWDRLFSVGGEPYRLHVYELHEYR